MFPFLHISSSVDISLLYWYFFVFLYVYLLLFSYIFFNREYLCCNNAEFRSTFILFVREESSCWRVMVMDFHERWEGCVSKRQRRLMNLGGCCTTWHPLMSDGFHSRVIVRLDYLMIFVCTWEVWNGVA